MSFADPQTVTISGTPVSLPRTSTQGDDTEYTSADGLVKLSASHSQKSGKRYRRVIRIDHGKLSADPHKPAENVEVGMSIYTVFDLPPAGYTTVEQLAIWTGWNTQLVASSNLLISKLLAGES